MATAGRKSGTLIQALRYLGQDQVDDRVLAALRRRIADEDRPGIRKDLRHAPAWIADLLRPFRARMNGGAISQGVALGWYVSPLWG